MSGRAPAAATASPAAPPAAAPAATLGANVRLVAPLAWPVLVGQLAVIAFSTVDTLLVARSSPQDLAALAIGGAAYITIFIGLMGVVLAVSPIVGQLHGARRWTEAGAALHQAVWIAIGASVIGALVLVFPAPFLALARVEPEVEPKVRLHLLALAVALPAALLFTCYRGFNTAVSRPKAVMVLQLAGLALKVPLAWALVFGLAVPTPLGTWQLPAMGVVGCGISTAMAMWAQLLVAGLILKRDPFYSRFGLLGRGLHRPDLRAIGEHLRLGVPMGLSIAIEVTGFTFMALFIARLGTASVAGHQIAANLVALLFMVPLALSNATSTLVAQSIGAGQLAAARRLGWHGLVIALTAGSAVAVVLALGSEQIVRLYTDNPVIVAAALPLVAWIGVFHIADAAQAMAAFVLRAWRIATVPVLIYAGSLWGVGLGGGYLLAFNIGGAMPVMWHGAVGFWVASTAGLFTAAVGLVGFMGWIMSRPHATDGVAPPGAVPTTSATSPSTPPASATRDTE